MIPKSLVGICLLVVAVAVVCPLVVVCSGSLLQSDTPIGMPMLLVDMPIGIPHV